MKNSLDKKSWVVRKSKTAGQTVSGKSNCLSVPEIHRGTPSQYPLQKIKIKKVAPSAKHISISVEDAILEDWDLVEPAMRYLSDR